MNRRNTQASTKVEESDPTSLGRRTTNRRRNTQASTRSGWPHGSDATSSDSTPEGPTLADELEGFEDDVWEEFDEDTGEWVRKGNKIEEGEEAFLDDEMVEVMSAVTEEVREMKDKGERSGGGEMEVEEIDENMKNEALVRLRKRKESRKAGGEEGGSA